MIKKSYLLLSCMIMAVIMAGCSKETVQEEVITSLPETSVQEEVSTKPVEEDSVEEPTQESETLEEALTSSPIWADGVYTEIAKGKDGDFEVTVTIENGAIKSITVGENNEAPDKGKRAIEQLPGEMIAKQTYEVDIVSGATVTSEGLKDAVARCLESASKAP